MDKIFVSTNVEKKRKAIDLPKDVVTVLAVQAAKMGISTKALMEKLLIEAASEHKEV